MSSFVPEPSRAKDTKLRVLDLFSGIGGFSLGLERTGGFETVAFCEIEPFCRQVLRKHWPDAPCYEDVRTLTADRLAADGIAVDAICGGFPCQDLSYAGKGAGLAGERSGLWREYARLIGELRPRFVIVENVSALLGRGLGDVLGDLATLGYDAWWDCIPASAVGAPHRRDRVWLVAYARGQQHEGYSEALRRAVASGLHSALMADTYGLDRRPGKGTCGRRGVEEGPEAGDGRADVADADRQRCREEGCGSHGCGTCRSRGAISRSWVVEPAVRRVAHGVPAELDGANGAIQEHDQEGCSEGDGERGSLPALRRDGEAGATSPRLQQTGDRGGSVSALPCEGRPEGRNAQDEADEDLRNLRGVLHPNAQQEAHALLAGLSVGSWSQERTPSLGWAVEPNVGRVAHGVAARVDRLHGLGNAVVPQIPEILGRAILEAAA